MWILIFNMKKILSNDELKQRIDSFEEYLKDFKREDYIKLDQCKERFLYKIHSRNLKYGVFNGKSGFIGIRFKFETEYLFTELHWDVGPPYGTVRPFNEICKIPDDIECSIGDWGKDQKPIFTENKKLFEFLEKYDH